MRIGTPLSPSAIKVMLLGSGELGKEVVIELQRLGVETIAVDRYADAPAQQVAHRAHVIDIGEGADALINPEILQAEGDEVGVEGCLSIPRLQDLRIDERVR